MKRKRAPIELITETYVYRVRYESGGSQPNDSDTRLAPYGGWAIVVAEDATHALKLFKSCAEKCRLLKLTILSIERLVMTPQTVILPG